VISHFGDRGRRQNEAVTCFSSTLLFKRRAIEQVFWVLDSNEVWVGERDSGENSGHMKPGGSIKN